MLTTPLSRPLCGPLAAALTAARGAAPATVPDAPTIGTATAGDTEAEVTFTPPADDGGSAITGYTVTSTPGSLTGTGAGSPITVTGLTNGVEYTFTVHATNAVGDSAESAASNAVTPAFAPSLTNLVLWLDPNDATTLPSPTGLVYSVTDKSGEGNDVTAQTGKPLGLRANPYNPARRMLKIEGGASGVGGFVRLNGLAATLNTAAWSVIFVAAGNVTTAKTIFGAGNSGSATPLIQLDTTSGKYRLFIRNSGTYTQSSSVNADSALHVFEIRLTGARAQLWVDGVMECDAAWTETNNVNRVNFGALERTTITECCDVLLGTALCYSVPLADGTVAAALAAQEIPALANACAKPAALLGLPKLARPTLSGATYSSSYSTAFHYADAALTSYYIDPLTGDNGAAGTEAAPFKDMNTALAQADVDCVIVAPGVYTQDEPWTTYVRPNRSVIIDCPDGRAVFGKFETASWALTAAQTFTYEHTLVGTLLRMHDYGVLDADGIATVLTSRASVALVEANPGSYFNDSGTLYVHTADSRPADRSVLVELTGPTAPQLPYNAAGFFLAVRNLDFVGVTPFNDVGGCNFYAESVRSSYPGAAQLSGTDEAYRLGCVSKYTAGNGDFWSYTNDVAALEQDCIAKGAGAADTDNCSTCHISAVALRIGNVYEGGKRTVHDGGSSMSWNLGCTQADALTGGANTDLGWTCGDIGVSSACQMWLDGCAASGNTVDIFTGTDAATRYRNMTIGNFTTTEQSGATLTAY